MRDSESDSRDRLSGEEAVRNGLSESYEGPAATEAAPVRRVDAGVKRDVLGLPALRRGGSDGRYQITM